MTLLEGMAFLSGWSIGGIAMDIHPSAYAAGLVVGLAWIFLTRRYR